MVERTASNRWWCWAARGDHPTGRGKSRRATGDRCRTSQNRGIRQKDAVWDTPYARTKGSKVGYEGPALYAEAEGGIFVSPNLVHKDNDLLETLVQEF